MSESKLIVRPLRKLLRAVGDLHIRGYQRLRIMPFFGGPGAWRCVIAPAQYFSSRHGAELVTDAPQDLTAIYSSAGKNEYWGWKDTMHCTSGKLAEVFLEKYPEIAKLSYGQDWLYGGWYQYMLHHTYPDLLPIVYADHNDIRGYVALATTSGFHNQRLALPPPGLAASPNERPW